MHEITVYHYKNPLTLTWNGTEATVDGLRQEIDWGSENMRNRAGIYLVADPRNETNIRVFLSERTFLPTGPTGAVPVDEPIVQDVDNNNRRTALFYIGPGDKIYVEPAAYQGVSGSPFAVSATLYVYQVAGTPVKYFGL